MHFADALDLQVGDRIAYGDHTQGRLCSYSREGQVAHVTLRGGIKVFRVIEGKVTSRTQWVCYAHVFNRC